MVDGGAAHSRVQAAGNGEQAVANDLGLGAAGRPTPEEDVVRVAGEVRRVRLRILTVGRAGDDQAVDCLHAPAAFHEFGREPVEQGRVRRPLAVAAEVVDRRHDRPAEMTAPEMIDGHAGRQWVATGR